MNDVTSPPETSQSPADKSTNPGGSGNVQHQEQEVKASKPGGINPLLAERLRKYPRKRRTRPGASPKLCGDDCANGIVAISSAVRGCVEILECANGTCRRIMTLCPQKNEGE